MTLKMQDFANFKGELDDILKFGAHKWFALCHPLASSSVMDKVWSLRFRFNFLF
jgi:hypothetical protein